MKRTVLTLAISSLALAALPAVAPALASAASTNTAVIGAAATSAATASAAASTPGALRFLPRAHAGMPGIAQLPHFLPGSASASTLETTNWSGYAVKAHTGVALRFAAASWTVPGINCLTAPAGGSSVATFVGLDGLTDKTIEQVGTSASCASTGATPTYIGFFDVAPGAPVVFSGFSPGDAINASVFFNGSDYVLTLTDLTLGASLMKPVPCPAGSTCRNSSAEVITEGPVGSAVALGKVGQANFIGAAVTSRNGTKGSLAAAKLWDSVRIKMVSSSGLTLASAGPLYGGRAFQVTNNA